LEAGLEEEAAHDSHLDNGVVAALDPILAAFAFHDFLDVDVGYGRFQPMRFNPLFEIRSGQNGYLVTAFPQPFAEGNCWLHISPGAECY
jgi:hypothetical protein